MLYFKENLRTCVWGICQFLWYTGEKAATISVFLRLYRYHYSQGGTIASLDKGTHARRTLRHAFRRVIVLDLRQQACVLCLAKTAPERPAGLRVFPEDKRQLARQTRQMGWPDIIPSGLPRLIPFSRGWRPSTRITKSDVV